MNLPKCLQRYTDKISEVSDERSTDEGYWVYLAPGWRDDEGETHCIHEDTIKECAAKMKYVTRCTSPGCCTP